MTNNTQNDIESAQNQTIWQIYAVLAKFKFVDIWKEKITVLDLIAHSSFVPIKVKYQGLAK